MEERRRSEDSHWEEIQKFISESREYRSNDILKQNYQLDAITALVEKVKIQSGRIGKLEIHSALLTGGLAVIVFGLPFIINYLFHLK